jgi:hypothetical protein
MPVFVWLLGLLLPQAGAQVAAPRLEDIPRHVGVRLSIRDGKTAFRSGEPIRLIASFTADRPGYVVDTMIDNDARMEDEILIAPERGVLRWQELYLMPDARTRDVVTSNALSTTPVEMTLPLNYWFRFDEPGEYTVRVRMRRVYSSPGLPFSPSVPWLTTNAVSFTVRPMSEPEEEIEAGRLGALLDELRGTNVELSVQTERCQDLAFLVGEAGAREKVRQYLNPAGRYEGNWQSDLGMGLRISRSTSLVVSLLEAEMRDLTKPLNHIWSLADLRVWMEMPGLVADAGTDLDALRRRKRERHEAIWREYVNEAVASLSLRTGAARRDTAASLLSLLGSPDRASTASGARPAIPPAVRQIVVDEFAMLDWTTQGFLVQIHWKHIRDPKLVPALERMTRSPDSWSRQMPWGPLLELAPDRAKSIFIAEMLGPFPVSNAALLGLRDQTLPEVDRPLVEQVMGLVDTASPRSKFALRTKTRFLARYATTAVLADLRRLYESAGSQLEREVRVNLLAYLDRWDEAGAPDRLALALVSDRDGGALLSELAGVRYSTALHSMLRSRLESADPALVEHAASLLSQFSGADGRPALENRLERWLHEWSGRSGELEPTAKTLTVHGRLQISLIRAILDGKSWTVSEPDATRLKLGCVTESCRRAFAAR